jgi:hypothetical protein
MAKKEGTKITNQVTPNEVKDKVAAIDAELPENLQEEIDKEKEKEAGEAVEEEHAEGFEDAGTLEVTDEETPVVVPEEEDETPTKPEIKKPVKQELPSPEVRARESGQEAMVLNSKNKKILETIEEANNIPEPTIEELKEYATKMGAEYDELDTFSQNMLKKTFKSEKKDALLTNLVADEKNMKIWQDKVEEFAADETTLQDYPSLAGHEEDFVKYCSKKTHINADFNLLVAGFLFKLPEENKNRNLLLPRGGGSKNGPAKPVELNQDDARVMRQKNPKKYLEMVQAGKFKVVID